MGSYDDFPSEAHDLASKVISINNDENDESYIKRPHNTNVDSEDAQETEDSGTSVQNEYRVLVQKIDTEWKICKENEINGIAGFYDDY